MSQLALFCVFVWDRTAPGSAPGRAACSVRVTISRWFVVTVYLRAALVPASASRLTRYSYSDLTSSGPWCSRYPSPRGPSGIHLDGSRRISDTTHVTSTGTMTPKSQDRIDTDRMYFSTPQMRAASPSRTSSSDHDARIVQLIAQRAAAKVYRSRAAMRSSAHAPCDARNEISFRELCEGRPREPTLRAERRQNRASARGRPRSIPPSHWPPPGR